MIDDSIISGMPLPEPLRMRYLPGSLPDLDFGMDFEPLQSSRTVDKIASQLREMIVSGQLKFGDKLPPERELAGRFGVGRYALREALRSLEMIGLIELRLGKSGGAFVTAGRPDLVSGQLSDLLRMGNVSLASVIEARIWIGEIVVRAACERHTDEDVEALEANIGEVERLFAAGRFVEKTRKNVEFHTLLARATKNLTLMIVMQSLTTMAAHFTEIIGPDQASVTVRSRRTFMEAFIARDVAGAVGEMTASLLRLQKVYADLAAEQTAFTSGKPEGQLVPSPKPAPKPRLKLAPAGKTRGRVARPG